MTNRLTAAVRWLAQQARIHLAPKRAAREVWRLLGDESTGPRASRLGGKRRTRQAGILKAVLRVLAQGPCPLNEVVAQASYTGSLTATAAHWCGEPTKRVYTRSQVLAALRYAEKRGYVQVGGLTDEGKPRWVLTLDDGARLVRGVVPPGPPPGPDEKCNLFEKCHVFEKVQAETHDGMSGPLGHEPQPGEWFPAKFGVPRPDQLPAGVIPPAAASGGGEEG